MLSREEFQALEWTTPTKRAEAVYQTEQAKRQPRAKAWRTGPAGVPIPPAADYFRMTMDGTSLSRIAAAAYADFAAAQLPVAWRAEVAEALYADIIARFPPADMAVLERYGFTHRATRVSIRLDRPGDYQRPEHLDLPSPVDVPGRGEWFGLNPRDGDQPLPAAQVAFAEAVIAVRAAQLRDFHAAVAWPAQFKNRERRAPTWTQIEAAWPQVGAWMAYQRNPW